jgi:hypothetical protein
MVKNLYHNLKNSLEQLFKSLDQKKGSELFFAVKRLLFSHGFTSISLQRLYYSKLFVLCGLVD